MSKWLVEFHPGAEKDLLEGFEWYAERNPDSAIALRETVKTAKNVISRAPQVWPTFSNGTQKYRLQRFPYKIIYRFIGDTIQIVAVAHDKRRPNYWAKRLDSPPT